MDGRGRDGRRDHHREQSRDRRDREGGRDGRERERERERPDRERERERGGRDPPPQRSSGRAQLPDRPPRPHSRAGDSEGGRAADQPDRPPRRAPSNPLLAEAARLARERLAAREEAAGSAAAAGSDHDSAPGNKPAAAAARPSWRDEEGHEDGDREGGRGSWRDKEEGGGAARNADQEEDGGREEGEVGAEPGELPAEGSPQQRRRRQQGQREQQQQEGGGAKKRKHAPIVWHTPPKQAKTEGAAAGAAAAGGMHHAQSSSGINALAGAGGGASPEPLRPRSAAEIAQAELAAFAAAQAELDGLENEGRGYMKDSPDVSSPEEEQHIRREVTEPLHSRGEKEGGSPGGVPRQKTRWLDDAEPAAERAGPSVGPAPLLERGSPGSRLERATSSDDERRQEQGSGSESEGEGGSEDEAPAPPAKRQVSMLDECRSVDRYEKLNRINEGTYGVVYRARYRETGEICALKKVKLEKERDGFPLTSVREINILLSLNHPNIVNVSEVVVGSSLDSVFMVMEYADHDLKAVMENRMTQPFKTAEVKCLMWQLLSGVAYLHEHWVLHRDLKTSNILYTNRGELKLCDFGLARQYGSPLKPYTHMVVTLWYRAIELLLGAKTYSTAVDMWSCGCIMAELLSREPLFPGKSEMDQINLIFKTLGTPTEATWPGLSKLPNFKRFNFASGLPNTLRQKFPPQAGLLFDGRPALSDAGFDLLSRLLDYCPERRISAAEALEHPWFRENPRPVDMVLMPTFPATNDAAHAHGLAAKRKAAAA